MSRIHFQGGSILNTSRANPTKKTEDLQRVIATLDALKIGYLATIGGDDTMFAASQVAKHAEGESGFVTFRRPSIMTCRYRERFPRSVSRPPGNGASIWYKT